MLRRVSNSIGGVADGVERAIGNYAIEAFNEILKLFLDILFALRFPLIVIATCFLMPRVTDLTIAVLGSTFVPFGLAAICIPFCYYAYQGIISLIHFCGYQIVDPYQERLRIEREREFNWMRNFPRSPFENMEFSRPLLHNFNHGTALGRQRMTLSNQADDLAREVPTENFVANVRL